MILNCGYSGQDYSKQLTKKNYSTPSDPVTYLNIPTLHRILSKVRSNHASKVPPRNCLSHHANFFKKANISDKLDSGRKALLMVTLNITLSVNKISILENSLELRILGFMHV